MNSTTKIILGIVGLGALGVGFYFGRKAYIRKQTTSANPEKNERLIVVNK
jgi:hypothetical protein